MKSDKPAFACSLTALTPAQREEHGENTQRLFATLKQAVEETDGYSLYFGGDTGTMLQIAEFISLERLCCPFFDFTLRLKSGDEMVALRLAGSEGIKEFIRSEFGEVIR